MCPHCHQHAPIVYRGVSAFCTGCGAPRMPLASTSVNLAGQPTKVGGTVARVIGWIALTVGTLIGLGSLGACGAIFGFATAAPWVVSIPILLVTFLLARLLLKSGKNLEQSGVETQKATRNHALFALANTRGGVLTANDAAIALNVPPPEADAILTSMAKETPDHVSVDVNDDGVVLYKFSGAEWRAMQNNPAAWERPRSRVANTPNTRVETREPLVDDFEERLEKSRQAR